MPLLSTYAQRHISHGMAHIYCIYIHVSHIIDVCAIHALYYYCAIHALLQTDLSKFELEESILDI